MSVQPRFFLLKVPHTNCHPSQMTKTSQVCLFRHHIYFSSLKKQKNEKPSSLDNHAIPQLVTTVPSHFPASWILESPSKFERKNHLNLKNRTLNVSHLINFKNKAFIWITGNSHEFRHMIRWRIHYLPWNPAEKDKLWSWSITSAKKQLCLTEGNRISKILNTVF